MRKLFNFLNFEIAQLVSLDTKGNTVCKLWLSNGNMTPSFSAKNTVMAHDSSIIIYLYKNSDHLAILKKCKLVFLLRRFL